MIELTLVNREQKGRNVTYGLTEMGSKLVLKLIYFLCQTLLPQFWGWANFTLSL